MPPLTLSRAAKECGKSKSALLDAIRAGRLSATRNDMNQWQIDPAELFRVYPANQSESEQKEQHQPPNESQPNAILLEKIANFEQKLKIADDERERERQQMQATIEDLRRRLDDEATERRKLTALLTHQPEPKAEPAADPARPSLMVKLFGRRGTT